VGPGRDPERLHPDDLLAEDEADPLQAGSHFEGMAVGVPDIADLETRDELEGSRPVGAGITGDAGVAVAL
jgi:hypothetical protein